MKDKRARAAIESYDVEAVLSVLSVFSVLSVAVIRGCYPWLLSVAVVRG
jgi:hypothetical protein